MKYFKGVGTPEELDPVRLRQATENFIEWGLGEPVFYDGCHGWRARFPDSQKPNFEARPIPMLMAPHVTTVAFQISMMRNGIIPMTIHPFIHLA